MQLIEAAESNNLELLDFFNKTLLPGIVDLVIQRPKNFFSHYKMQTDHYHTYVLLNNRNEIEAMASILFIPAVLNGQEQMVGFATDLRVSNNRFAVLHWSQYFLPVLETLKRRHMCEYVFSIVNPNEKMAYNSLVRPRNPRRSLPRYHLYRDIDVVAIHGRQLFWTKPLSTIQIRSATREDVPTLVEYLVARNQGRSLYFIKDQLSFMLRLERWPGLFIEDFLLAFDSENRLVGCVAPWRNDVQKYLVGRYHNLSLTLYDFLKFASWLQWLDALPKPMQNLPLTFLTHLRADNPDIFRSLIYAAYRRRKKNEILVYGHSQGDWVTKPPKTFFNSKVKMGLYSIMPPTRELPDFLRPSPFAKAPELEIAWF